MKELIEEMEARRRAAHNEYIALGEALVVLRRRRNSTPRRARGGSANVRRDKIDTVEKTLRDCQPEALRMTSLEARTGLSNTTIRRAAQVSPLISVSRVDGSSRALQYKYTG